ncbi:nuclease A inhibitor family protein [Pontibacter brevis]
MNNPDSPAIQPLLQELSAASDGLFYISETDHPFEAVHIPQVQDSSALPAALAQLPDVPEDAIVEVVDLSYFFRNMTRVEEPDAGEEERKSAHRFRELQELLEQRLQEIKVYRIGKRRIHAFILGKAATADFAGLRTVLVET